MKTFKVTIVRCENVVYEYLIDAKDSTTAENLAMIDYDDGEKPFRKEVVFGEEFINGVEEVNQ